MRNERQLRAIGLSGSQRFAAGIFLMLAGAEVRGAPVITSWESSGGSVQNKDDAQDTMYLVQSGDALTFSVTASGASAYAWFVNKADQGVNDATFAWSVPNEKAIWEVRVEASDGATVAKEWVVATLSAAEAPNFFDSFTDGKCSGRTETDPWGRRLRDWNGSPPDAGQYLLNGAGDMSQESDVAWGTWKLRWRFPGNQFRFFYLQYQGGGSDDTFFVHRDGTSYNTFWTSTENNGMGGDLDSGFYPMPGRWYAFTIVRTQDGTVYLFADDRVEFIAAPVADNPDSFIARFLRLQKMGSENVDGFEAYKHRVVLPFERSAQYRSYVANWHAPGTGDYEPVSATGVVVRGWELTLPEIARLLNNRALFDYDAASRTATVNADLVLDEGSALLIENEKLQFNSGTDGQFSFVVKSKATLRIINSVVSTTADAYFNWVLPSGTHFGFDVGLDKTFTDIQGLYYNTWGGYVVLEIDGSVIDNFAYLFLANPFDASISNSKFLRMHEADTGDYSVGFANNRSENQARKDFVKGAKSFWLMCDWPSPRRLKLENLVFEGEAPARIQFFLNDDHHRLGLNNVDFADNEVVVSKSRQQGSYWFPQGTYYESTLSLVNARFAALVAATDKARVIPKYYLGARVVDGNDQPLAGAVISVTNEVDDANFPSENIEPHQEMNAASLGANRGDPRETSPRTQFWSYSPLRSTITGTDGRTPSPADRGRTLVVADQVVSAAGRTAFSYTVTAGKDGVQCSAAGIDPDESWYRPDPEVATCTVTIKLAAPCPPATVSCQPYGTIAGTVRAGGAPVQGATVEDGTISASTGASGAYRLGPLAAGHYQVTASKAGQGSQTKEADVAPGQIVGLDFELAPPTAEDGGPDESADAGGDSPDGEDGPIDAGADGGEEKSDVGADVPGDDTNPAAVTGDGCGCGATPGRDWIIAIVIGLPFVRRPGRRPGSQTKGDQLADY